MTGVPISVRLQDALACHRRGDVSTAERLYRDVLGDAPRNFDALHLLGVATATRGDLEQGIELIRQAIEVDPSQASAHFSAAQFLLAKGEHGAALESAGRVTALQPDHAPGWFLQGNALLHLQRPEASARSLRRAVDLQPEFPEACSNLAAALRALNRTNEARAFAERALALRPAYPKALNNLGLILLDAQQAAVAAERFREALALDPGYAEALHNLGTALMQLRQYAAAAGAFLRLVELSPRFPHAVGHLLHAQLHDCDWRGYESLTGRIIAGVGRGEAADLPMSFMALSESAGLQCACARGFVRTIHPAGPHRHVAPAPRGAGAAPAVATPSRDRIRIAYLSADFKEHPVAQLLAGVAEQHDRSRFEVHAFSLLRSASPCPMRQRLQSAFEHFHDVGHLGDRDIAQSIRSLGVDILVDLNGHTHGNHLGVLALRPAPVQVNFLGYTGTTGADFIDYLIADAIAIPRFMEADFTERIVRLPGCFLPSDDRQPLPETAAVRHDLALPEAGFVFCAFHNAFKINPAIFGIWTRLLQAVPGSVLWLKTGADSMIANLRQQAELAGVDAERLVFAPTLPRLDEHFARYRAADLFLDTLPYGAHATARDALWAGLPVLTCAGAAFASRVAASLLDALGLPELVTHDLEQYFECALRLARDPAQLAALRVRLDASRRSSPVFSTALYCRRLEAAYRAMADRQQRGHAPQSIDVSEPPRPTTGRCL